MPKKSPRKFTAKQTAFIEAWDGNATKAAKAAGYCNPRQSAYDLLQNPYISDAIKNREALRVTEKVMTENEIREFWTQVARDTGQDIKDRLTACKLLAKAKGMFIQKVEHTGDVDHYHHGELPEAVSAMLDKIISGRGDEEGQGLHPLPHHSGVAREAA